VPSVPLPRKRSRRPRAVTRTRAGRRAPSRRRARRRSRRARARCCSSARATASESRPSSTSAGTGRSGRPPPAGIRPAVSARMSAHRPRTGSPSLAFARPIRLNRAVSSCLLVPARVFRTPGGRGPRFKSGRPRLTRPAGDGGFSRSRDLRRRSRVSTESGVYVYSGRKSARANAADAAGLNGEDREPVGCHDPAPLLRRVRVLAQDDAGRGRSAASSLRPGRHPERVRGPYAGR
jgi:hypothetical protein